MILGRTMAQTSTIAIELLEDDARAVVQAAGGDGPDLPHRLAALVAEGLDQYLRDEAAWEVAAGTGAGVGAQTPSVVLQHREAEALVVVMRARTITSERHVEALQARVRELAREHAAYREHMARLRTAAGHLRQRRAQLRAVLHGGASADAATRPLAVRIAARLRGMLRRGTPP
ncbi:MAG: hypothetical protein QN157_09250 [Armatimonadota bacterium]|nr:hypothetical protein [Armatimonadota bacterium]